jgi:NAD(P)-dependent dehydrogenase (short-subunit alcohol dehydrogenase family)
MRLDKAVALVTGANRGLGRSIVKALAKAGVPRIHAAARDPSQLADFGSRTSVLPLALDITDGAQVARAASHATDVTLLINNAGLLPHGGAMSVSEKGLRAAIEVNLMGTWRMTRAFAPVIEANGGGAIVNILSLISLHNTPPFAAYSAAKHASWAMTQSFRDDLAGTRVRVVACFPGGIDTDMLAGVPAVKAHPDSVAASIVEAIRRGDAKIFPDRVSAIQGPALLGIG